MSCGCPDPVATQGQAEGQCPGWIWCFWSSKGWGGGIQPLEASLPCALQGEHLVGKYCCLLCPKEFSSESGVKYHILKTHAEVGCAGSPVGLAGDWATVGVVG